MIKYDAENKPTMAFEVNEWRMMMIHLQLPEQHYERVVKLAHFITGIALRCRHHRGERSGAGVRGEELPGLLRTAGAAMIGAAIVLLLTSCQEPAPEAPRTPVPVEESSLVDVYEDKARNVVCYIYDGIEEGADLSCLQLTQP